MIYGIEMELISILTKQFFLGSFHTTAKHSLPIWRETAKLVFDQPKEDDFVKKRGVYDKMIIDCAFRKDLRRRKIPDPNGGCEGFNPSLTTNGMCYTFNGKKTPELWQTSKMITTFANLFPLDSKNNKTFGGRRTVQGIPYFVHMLVRPILIRATLSYFFRGSL